MPVSNPNNHSSIEKALQYLSNRCDVASAIDGAGFNRMDAAFGHSLAINTLKYNLTDKQHIAALKMLQKYSGQLAIASIFLPSLTELTEWLSARVLDTPPIPASTTVDVVDDLLEIRFPYCLETIRRVKELDGKWNPVGKFWTVESDRVEQLKSALPASVFSLSAETILYRAIAIRQQQEAMAAAAIAAKQQEDMELLSLACLENELPCGRTLFDHQKTAVKEAIALRKMILADDMGLGKAEPLSNKILTPFGQTRMGDIKIGDFVIGSDGRPTKVTGVYPQGLKSIYRVTFSDDVSVDCCDEHLWAIQTPTQKARGNEFRVFSLSQIMKMGLTHANGNSKYYIPMVKPVEFNSCELVIHPYVLGVLIGDGSLSGDTPSWTKPSPEIAEFISNLLPSDCQVNFLDEERGLYSIVRCKPIDTNTVTRELKALGLYGCRSHEKFIPDNYKFSSIENRVALLQGLMDTDGCVDTPNGIVITYSSSSEQLAKDVQFIVESLGGTAKMSTREPFYTYKGEVRQGKTSYRLNIRLPHYITPFRASIKRDKYTPRSKYQPTRAIRKIEYIGEKECQCISVSASDSLYVTEHCVVTHNTKSALVAAKAFKLRFNCPVFVVCPASLKENWVREAEMVGVDIEVFSAHHNSLPQPLMLLPYVLIVDEAHLFASTQKTKRFDALTELAHSPNCKLLILATGTPLRNGDPLNLFALLSILNHPISHDKKLFKRNYCKGKASHLDQLHRIITKDPETRCMIRRTKKQCLDLPQFTRVFRNAEISQEAIADYEKKWNQLRKDYYDRIQEGKISSEGEAIVMLNHLRHAASHAKIENAIEIAQEVLEQGEQVLLFTTFKNTAIALAEKLGCEVIDGDANSRCETQSICDRFQNGTNQALVCMFGAGGVGLNLTAASTVILVDRPWTTADTEQSEARAHRTGQYFPVTAIWLQCFEIDLKIDAVLSKKAERIDLILKGKRASYRGVDKIDAIEFLQDLMA